MTVSRNRQAGAERKLSGHHSILGQGAGSISPPETPWGVPHLRAAAFLDPVGMRPVGDPNSLRSGEQREVEWVGSRLHFAGWLFGSWMFGEAFSGATCLLFVLLEYLAHPIGIFSSVRHGIRLAGGFLHINLRHGAFWIQRGRRSLGLF